MNNRLTSSEAIHTTYYIANSGIPIALGLLIVMQIIEILLGIYIVSDYSMKWVMYFLLVPLILLMLFWPYKVKIILNKYENSISFRWMSIIPFVWNCKDTLLHLNEIDFFKLELTRLLNKRYYKIWAKLKNTPNDVCVISGQDQSCSFEYSDKMQIFTNELNGLIRN